MILPLQLQQASGDSKPIQVEPVPIRDTWVTKETPERTAQRLETNLLPNSNSNRPLAGVLVSDNGSHNECRLVPKSQGWHLDSSAELGTGGRRAFDPKPRMGA